MKKIIIIGSCGAGKSTFARKLRNATGLPLHYLDLLWHRHDRTTASREEFDAALERILQGEEWIIDGHYSRTLEKRLKACDTVFLLDFPPEECLAGAEARIGKAHEDMPWVDDKLSDEMRNWIIDFPEKELCRTYQLLRQYEAGKEIIVFKSRREAELYLKTLAKN